MRKHTKKLLCTILVVLAAGACASVALAAASITPDPTSITFTAANVGYAQPAAKTFTLKNNGDIGEDIDDLTVTIVDDDNNGGSAFIVEYKGGSLGNSIGDTLAGDGGELTGFTVLPVSGLSSGTYNLTITFSSSSASVSATVTASFKVNSSETDITNFSLQGGIALTGLLIDPSAHTITANVPSTTNVASLTPDFILSPGATINPSGAQNFTNPFTYTVTAEDGTTQQPWTVTLTKLPSTSTDNSITNFAIPNMIGTPTVDTTAGTIAVTMPYGTNVTALTPTFTIHSEASVDKASGAQQNFSSPVTYKVTAGNGTAKNWTVTVSIQQVGMKTFYLAGVAGTITSTSASTGTIVVNLPYGTNKSSLIPTYTFDGSSCSLVSGVAVNFTNPQTVTVYAPAGGTNMVYTVTVNVATSPSAECNITSFSIPNMLTSPTINHTAGTILVTLPWGSSVTSLTPTVTVSTGATLISPSATTINFTNPVIYTVRAQDGTTTKSYVVTVTFSSSSSQDGNYYSRTITGTSGVSISGSSIHSSATLSVTENSLHSSGSCSACDHIRSWMAINRVVKCYNISLTNGFTGSVTVSIPVGSSYNGNQLTMLHCNNGVLERTNATVFNGSISASYTSLSPFAVLDGVYSSLPGDSADPPKTGDEDIYFSWGALLITLALFLATVCGMILLNKRRNILS